MTLAFGVLTHALPSCDEASMPQVPSGSGAPRCGLEGRVVLQVLGSGGPIADDGRASSSYLVWHEGRARVLVDVGGGTFLRFGESGARLEDLDAIAISHLHADHAGGLPPLLKSGYFAPRRDPLPLFGPSGNERFPATDDFVKQLLDPEVGAFKYLSGYLDGSSLFPLPVTVVDAEATTPSRILDAADLAIDSVGVHHGTIPAVGYLVTVAGVRIAFAGDQSAENAPFVAMAEGADALVMHHAIPEGADQLAHLHATPEQIGDTAAKAGPGLLVLGHNMRRALDRRDASEAAIRASFDGPLAIADDLSCYILAP